MDQNGIVLSSSALSLTLAPSSEYNSIGGQLLYFLISLVFRNSSLSDLLRAVSFSNSTMGGASSIPSFEFGMEMYRNNAKQWAITSTDMGYSFEFAFDPQGTKRITFTTQPVGTLRAGCSMSMSDNASGNISIGDAYTYRAIRFYVAPTPGKTIGQEDGASTPVLQLFKSGKTGTQYAFVSGSIRYTGNISQYSDIRAKKDIKPLDTDILMLVKPVEFRMISDDADLHWGFVAQDVADALEADNHEDSALYCDDMPAMLGVAYTELIAPLVAGY